MTSLYPPDGHWRFSERRSSPRARAQRTVYTPLQMSGDLRREIRN